MSKNKRDTSDKVKYYESLNPELNNLHRFRSMEQEIIKNEYKDKRMITYLNPRDIDYWTINDNIDVYEHIKNDSKLAKRCFLYLKQIKYLLKDIEKMKIKIKKYKEIAEKNKDEKSLLHGQVIALKNKVIFLQKEQKKVYMPKLNYEKIVYEPYYTDMIECHTIEFKDRKLCYDYTKKNNINYAIKTQTMYKIIKTIVGFLNADGGTLYIGICDDGQVTGVKFQNREHLDQFMKQIDNILITIRPIIIDNFYNYKFWKVRDRIVMLITVNKQKGKKIRYILNNKLYVRNHTITRSIKLINK